DSYPARVRNILIIAAPFWFRPPYHLSRLFVKDKIRERIFAIERRQLINFLPIASIPQGLGGTLSHRHIDWLRTCFDRLGSSVLSNGKEEDYFNPMKVLPPSFMLSRRLSFTQPHHQFTLDRYDIQRNQVHHFPHQRVVAHGMNGNRTISTNSVRKDTTAWTYNRLLRPGAPKNHLNSISLSDDEDNSHNSLKHSITSSLIVTNNNNNNKLNSNGSSKEVVAPPSTATSLTSPTRISVDQFLSEFPRKFPSTFEREFEVSIRPIGSNCPTSAVNGNSAMTSTTRFSDRANYAKNRYVDVPCLDHSAVILPGDGYIHANYVDGYLKRKAYILTQDPLTLWTVDAATVFQFIVCNCSHSLVLSSMGKPHICWNCRREYRSRNLVKSPRVVENIRFPFQLQTLLLSRATFRFAAFKCVLAKDLLVSIDLGCNREEITRV
ncbi:unnamed protein product, partial [Rodentolepis nana]|uniref:CRAL-TRIO domain-containing protein n=1 Tax=Rodentolepis nana TaxID=102285 RepID=A0A0R3T8X5_RODNA